MTTWISDTSKGYFQFRFGARSERMTTSYMERFLSDHCSLTIFDGNFLVLVTDRLDIACKQPGERVSAS